MEKLNHLELINLLLQLAIMLIAARGMAEAARRLKQPPVVGEILAGVILGPTILGHFFPETMEILFPAEGTTSLILDGFVQIAVVLLLFIAGLEVELHLVLQQGRAAFLTSLSSLVIPFILGFSVAFAFPQAFDVVDEEQRLVFALFIGTTLGITALPVIARVLLDLKIFKSPMGMLIIASAMIVDILGWLIFTVVLGLMDTGEEKHNIWYTIGMTLGFTAIMVTVGKALINRMMPWVNRKLSWPGGLLSMSLAVCFLAAAFTEWIGIHSIFGAFIIGVALGDSEYMSDRAKEIIHQFINNIFAPLFFVSIGLYVNFIESFNLKITLILIALAFTGKVVGTALGARAGGQPPNSALAIGFGMNTHGTLEVILAVISLNAGLINMEIFESIMIMVVVTIVVSAPLMKYWLKRAKRNADALEPAAG